MAASVVDLPEPVGPVTSTRPRGLSDRSPKSWGVELLQRQDLAGNGPEHGRRAAVLVEGVNPKARQAVNLEGEVDLQELLVGLALRVAHDVVHHAVHRLVVQCVNIDTAYVTVHADHRRQARGQVQIGSLVLTLNASSWVMSTVPSVVWYAWQTL